MSTIFLEINLLTSGQGWYRVIYMNPEEIDNMVSDLLDSVAVAITHSAAVPLTPLERLLLEADVVATVRDYYINHYGEN